jgi:hypothetical protein
MPFQLNQSRVKAIRKSDPDFNLIDGMVIVPRAMLHITPDCPYNHRQIINTCIEKGWLKPVAHVYDYEYTMDLLKEAQ